MAQLRQGAPSPEFSSRAELERHYAAVHARIFDRPPPRPAENRAAPAQPVAASDATPTPSPASWKASPAFVRTVRAILAEVSAEHRIPIAVIVGESKAKRVIEARWDAIVMIYEACPDVSLERIGRQFGRDRSSVINALRQRGVYIPRTEGRA